MVTSFLQVKNRATTTLATGITAIATTLEVASGSGSKFPTPGNGFHITIDSEIILVTGRANDVFTVTRGQESTTPATHAVGATVRLNITAKLISDLETAVNTAEGDIDDLEAVSHTQNTDTNLGTLGTKNPPIDADKVVYRDSTDSDNLVTSTWTQIKAFLKTYLDTLYDAIGAAAAALSSALSALSDHASDTSTHGASDIADVSDIAVDANLSAAAQAAIAASHTQGTDTALGTLGTKNPPVDADLVVMRDSASSWALFTSTLTQFKAYLKTYWDTIYAAISHAATHTNGTDDIQSATAAQKGLATAAQITKLDGIEALADVTDATNIGTSIHGVDSKATPVDNDEIPIIDSQASNVLKKALWSSVKATLKTYFDGLYLGGGTLSDLAGFAILFVPASTGLYYDDTNFDVRIRTSIAVAGDNILIAQGFKTNNGTGLYICAA